MKRNFFPSKTEKIFTPQYSTACFKQQPEEGEMRVGERAKQLRSFRFHSHLANVLPDTFERERLIVHRCLPLFYRYSRLVFD